MCRGDQVVLEGEQGGSGPGGDAELGVDVLDVVFGGATGDAQPSPDLRVRAALGDEAEDLHFPLAQPAGPQVGSGWRVPLTGGVEHRGDRVGVETATAGITLQF